MGEDRDTDVRVVLLSDGRPHEQGKCLDLFRTQLLQRRCVRSLKTFVMYTIGFGIDSDGFEMYLKPLSEATSGTFQISSLNQVELFNALASVTSSITTSRISQSGLHVHVDSRNTLFDTSCSQTEDCHRICKVLQVHCKRKLKKPGVQNETILMSHQGMTLQR